MRLTFLGKNREKHCDHLDIQSLLDADTAKSTENFVVNFLIHLLIRWISLPFSTQKEVIMRFSKK